MKSLTDATLLECARQACHRLMGIENVDQYGRYSPMLERLRSAVAQSEEAMRQELKYGDDH
jgi:hypothetical protein